MNVKSLSSVSSLLILLFSATFAFGQSNLIFTFDDSGPSATAIVTGTFDISGLTPGSQGTPRGPGFDQGAIVTVSSFGTTTAASVTEFNGGTAFGSPGANNPFLVVFPFTNNPIVTPLSEHLQFNTFGGGVGANNVQVVLETGQTIFDADALTNNVIVFQESSLSDLSRSVFGDGSFLSTTPTTVFSDPSGENTVQFVLAVPEPSSAVLLFATYAGIALLRRRR